MSPTPSKASSVRSGTIMNAVKKWWPIKETHSVENNGPLDRLAQSQDGEDMKRDLSQESLRQKLKPLHRNIKLLSEIHGLPDSVVFLASPKMTMRLILNGDLLLDHLIWLLVRL